MTPILPVLLLAASPAAPPATHYVETTPARRVTAEFVAELKATEYQPTSVRVVAAAAPELPHHQTGVKTTMTAPAAGEADDEKGPWRLPIAAANVKAAPGQKAFPVRVAYEATLLERRLRPLPPGGRAPAVPPLDAATRERALAETPLYDFGTPAVKGWLDARGLRRKPGEDDLAFGRRAYLAIAEQFMGNYYGLSVYKPASQLVDTTRSDCDCLSALFVTAMRANGVPARVLRGRPCRATQKPGKDGSLGGHAVAEFYADGVGWVPCDLSVAIRSPKRDPLASFGVSDGTFLVLGIDSELQLLAPGDKTPRKRATLTSPTYSARGKGKFDLKLVPEVWEVTVKKLDR